MVTFVQLINFAGLTQERQVYNMETMTSLSHRNYLIPLFLLFFITGAKVGFCKDFQPTMDDFNMPKKVSLCGEPVPLEKKYAFEMLDREITISAWDRAQVFMWLKRAGKYFPHMEKELKRAGLPDDLKYLAVAESSLIPYIRSSAGAMGTWQFMSSTARNHGIRRDAVVDERRNFKHATKAAMKYLKFLHNKFGSWTIAMAAYNCGENGMQKSINRQKTNYYYDLNLPLETERYIFRIAAIKTIMTNPEKYGYALSPKRVYAPVQCDTVMVRARGAVSIADLAQKSGTTYKAIKELNPQFLKSYLPSGHYELNVPPGLGPRTKKAVATLSGKTSTRALGKQYYKVRSGDTLIRISKKTGISVAKLKKFNRIKGSHIVPGQRLILTR